MHDPRMLVEHAGPALRRHGLAQHQCNQLLHLHPGGLRWLHRLHLERRNLRWLYQHKGASLRRRHSHLMHHGSRLRLEQHDLCGNAYRARHGRRLLRLHPSLLPEHAGLRLEWHPVHGHNDRGHSRELPALYRDILPDDPGLCMERGHQSVHGRTHDSFQYHCLHRLYCNRMPKLSRLFLEQYRLQRRDHHGWRRGLHLIHSRRVRDHSRVFMEPKHRPVLRLADDRIDHHQLHRLQPDLLQ